jgi:hypothetical protein
VGCWLEGGKLFKVHFRNVNAPLPHFVETFVDNGYMDMYKVMKALREVKFDGAVIADHVPGMVGGGRVGTAYSIGYIKALLDQVNAEARAYLAINQFFLKRSKGRTATSEGLDSGLSCDLAANSGSVRQPGLRKQSGQCPLGVHEVLWSSWEAVYRSSAPR